MPPSATPPPRTHTYTTLIEHPQQLSNLAISSITSLHLLPGISDCDGVNHSAFSLHSHRQIDGVASHSSFLTQPTNQFPIPAPQSDGVHGQRTSHGVNSKTGILTKHPTTSHEPNPNFNARHATRLSTLISRTFCSNGAPRAETTTRSNVPSLSAKGFGSGGGLSASFTCMHARLHWL